MRRRHLLLLLAAVATTFTLAGCGGASSDALHAVSTATTTTLSQTLVSDLTLQGATLDGQARTTVNGTGAFAFDTKRGYERIDLPANSHHAAGSEFLDFLPAGFYFTRTSSAGATTLTSGKPWVSTALTGPGSVDALVPRFVLQVEALSPQLLLDELAGGAEAATHLGEPVVDHVPLSEYRVSVSLTKAASTVSGALRTAIEDERTANGSATVPLTVWVDGPGHIVQVQGAVPGSGLGTVSMQLSSFGLKIPENLPTSSMLLQITARTPSGAGLLRSVWIF
jgi:hypothetical protein